MESTEDRFGLSSDAVTNLAPGGAFFGGQAGYNWQGLFGPGDHSVFGIEGDLQTGSGIEATRIEANFGDRLTSSLDWFGTLRARAGYAPSALTFFYATGGLAFGGLNKSISGQNPALGGSTFRFNDTAAGAVFGGGAEIKFTPALSFKFEFLAFDFGKNEPVNAAGAGLTGIGGRIRDDQFSTIRMGLSYYFGESGLGVPFKP
ncbi:MAG TPA: outer membrane beta-barrel protein [Hyphomicrobiales bacterium]|nr:outer membrane beta-barrel protein [Hyphomicrobiales bacterium]